MPRCLASAGTMSRISMRTTMTKLLLRGAQVGGAGFVRQLPPASRSPGGSRRSSMGSVIRKPTTAASHPHVEDPGFRVRARPESASDTPTGMDRRAVARHASLPVRSGHRHRDAVRTTWQGLQNALRNLRGLRSLGTKVQSYSPPSCARFGSMGTNPAGFALAIASLGVLGAVLGELRAWPRVPILTVGKHRRSPGRAQPIRFACRSPHVRAARPEFVFLGGWSTRHPRGSRT